MQPSTPDNGCRAAQGDSKHRLYGANTSSGYRPIEAYRPRCIVINRRRVVYPADRLERRRVLHIGCIRSEVRIRRRNSVRPSSPKCLSCGGSSGEASGKGGPSVSTIFSKSLSGEKAHQLSAPKTGQRVTAEWAAPNAHASTGGPERGPAVQFREVEKRERKHEVGRLKKLCKLNVHGPPTLRLLPDADAPVSCSGSAVREITRGQRMSWRTRNYDFIRHFHENTVYTIV